MPIKSNISHNSYTLMDSNLIVTTQGRKKAAHHSGQLNKNIRSTDNGGQESKTQSEREREQ